MAEKFLVETVTKAWRVTCQRCAHQWISKGRDVPKVCPACKSRSWMHPFRERMPVTCRKCGYAWRTFRDKPTAQCPNCKSRQWTEPKKRGGRG